MAVDDSSVPHGDPPRAGDVGGELPPSLRASPNIDWEHQSLEQLIAERDYWTRQIVNAPGFASAQTARAFRGACEAWIVRREREAAL